MTTTQEGRPTMTTSYTASIYDPEHDGTVEVDLRTLDTDRLRTLRDEAGAAGDLDLVATIDELLDR